MKVPTRSPTHADIELSRLSTMGLEVEELAEDGEVALPALVELAEDRGRPVSHYLAAAALQEVRIAPPPGATLTARVCAGTCQRWGALDLLDHLASIAQELGNAIGGKGVRAASSKRAIVRDPDVVLGKRPGPTALRQRRRRTRSVRRS
jgi:hypothetical protein